MLVQRWKPLLFVKGFLILKFQAGLLKNQALVTHILQAETTVLWMNQAGQAEPGLWEQMFPAETQALPFTLQMQQKFFLKFMIQLTEKMQNTTTGWQKAAETCGVQNLAET